MFQTELHECRAHLAHLAHRRGDERDAQAEIDAASRLYTEMGATAQAIACVSMHSRFTSRGSDALHRS